MIWVWVAGSVGVVVAGVALWLHRRRRLRQLINAAGALVQARSDLEYRRAVDKERLERHHTDGVKDIRQREEQLLNEVKNADIVCLIARLKRRQPQK